MHNNFISIRVKAFSVRGKMRWECCGRIEGLSWEVFEKELMLHVASDYGLFQAVVVKLSRSRIDLS
jgi:hypothetical protein